jgi:hypothetical protein
MKMDIDEVIRAIPERHLEAVVEEYTRLRRAQVDLDPAVAALALFFRLGANMQGMREADESLGGAVKAEFPDEIEAFRLAAAFIWEQVK